MTRRLLLLTSLLSISVVARAWATAEICGNGIDDDGNGMTDEGCYPAMTTGVCESPLSCGDTGMVSWTTGSLHYDLPPDIAPAVPFGPGIGFRRFYMSQFTPGSNPTSVNKTPLGPNWGHTYLTYLYAFTAGSGAHDITLHTSQGRDVLYTQTSTSGGYNWYTPQAGDHVMSLKYDYTNLVYYLQLLTGETLKYNSSGQLIEIWDTLATPNKVLVTWDSTTNGNVSTVTDANGKRRLLFSYTNGLMTSMQFQTYASSTWTTQHTTSYAYDNGTVTRDATSGWYAPASASEWTNLLAGTGFSNPSHLWLMQETSGSLADSIGSNAMTASGSPTYSASQTGWSRKGIKFTDGSTTQSIAATGLPDESTNSWLSFSFVAITANPSGGRLLAPYSPAGGGGPGVYESYNPYFQYVDSGLAVGTVLVPTTVVPFIVRHDLTHSISRFYDGSEILDGGFSSVTNSRYQFGTSGTWADAAQWTGYSALWTGSSAELSDSQITTLISRIENGPGTAVLTSVTIGGQLAQQYTYSATGYLAKIADGGGDQIAAFSYSSSTNGQVDRVATPRGTVGFEYASSRTGCTGDTILYFNQGNTSSCSVDSDCGTGFLCGGKTGSGSTGSCFLAGRCMTTGTVNGEQVVTAIAPLGPGGSSCTGACADVTSYVWATTSVGSNPAGLLDVAGVEDALGNYTSILYNSNGLPVQIGYGDTDADPTNGGTARTEYILYDTVFPGRVNISWHQSDLNTTSCTSADCSASKGCNAGCAGTINTFDATSHQLNTVQAVGYTLNSSGSVVSYANTTTFTHDTKGRISEIDGAVSGIKTTFDFYSSTDPNKDQFVSDLKTYKDATNYLEPQIIAYDFWGHATGVQAPDGNLTCDTYDSARGFLASRRRAMNGQTDCTTTNSADIITSWARDSWLRLTQLTRPDGSCVFYSYDSSSRPYQIKRRDDCNASSSGDTQQYSYTADSQISELDTYNASSTLTAKQPYTYFAGRQIQDIVNPVDTSKFTGLVYDAAGKLAEIDGPSGLSKTLYSFSGAPGRDGRVTSETRYKTSSAYDTWNLTYAWYGGQTYWGDTDGILDQTPRDDLGRMAEHSNVNAASTIRVFDAAGRVTSMVEGFGSTPVTHTFTFDNLSRPLNIDYAGACATTGTAHPEIQKTYDALPSGVSCPSAMTNACTNLTGRLAYVDTILMCSSTYSSTDGSLDQLTFYAYDKAGRVIEEYITDDSGRTADHLYSWTKNGVQSQVTTPSGAVIGATFGSSGNNSDTDKIAALWRTNTSTPIIDTVTWNPFGPLMQYNWEATSSGTGLLTYITRNLAYRPTYVGNAELSTLSSALDAVTLTEDAKGRVTSRVYSPHDPTFAGLFDSYYLYDEEDRVTCETTTSQTSCPTSGSGLKNNQYGGFMDGGDWIDLLRPIPGSTGLTNSFPWDSSDNLIWEVSQSDGTPVLGNTRMGADEFGNRTYDDNTSTLTNDRRDYTYDARHNLTNVRGQYYVSSAWHYYDVASSFDAGNRRVFKSFYDETSTKTATWFFYYDAVDRLTEVRYTPDTSSPSTYSLFQLFWLGNRLTLYWQVDYPSVTTSKRYVSTDETGRPIKLWNWPSSGSTTNVWAINPSAWAYDQNLVGPSVYQPILFAGQYQDPEAVAYENDGVTVHRPGLALNGFRTYDPFVGGYLQLDPMADQTRSSYVYVDSNPVGRSDRWGLTSGSTRGLFGTDCNRGGPEGVLCGQVQADAVSGADPAADPPPGDDGSASDGTGSAGTTGTAPGTGGTTGDGDGGSVGGDSGLASFFGYVGGTVGGTVPSTVAVPLSAVIRYDEFEFLDCQIKASQSVKDPEKAGWEAYCRTLPLALARAQCWGATYASYNAKVGLCIAWWGDWPR